MKNLEIKVEVNSLENIKKELSFAVYQGLLHQEDTYYLLGARRLKIREQEKIHEIIYYVRINKKSSRKSTYFRLVIPNYLLPFLKIVLNSIFKVKTVVIKERELYLYKNTRVHLDTVENMGYYLELETVINTKEKEDFFLHQHDEVKELLNLQKYKIVEYSYSDILISK